MTHSHRRIAVSAALPVLVILALSCRGNAPHGSTGGRNLSPQEVNFEDIRMNATKGEVSAKVQPLRCVKAGPGREICTWLPPKNMRDLEGYDEVRISFGDDGVTGIEVKYAELFDLQFRRVDRTVRERYGPFGGSDALDSVDCVWKYDSVTVRFSPHRKQHWTGSFYVYNPVLTIEETLPSPDAR